MLMLGKSPEFLAARVLTRMPEEMRRPQISEWGNANSAGRIVDSFLEGPCYDAAGSLYLVDIPHGRILRISRSLEWECIHEDDGWPNGLALNNKDGSIWIADYRKGIRRLDPASGQVETVLGHRNTESFKGVNDLVFDVNGRLYFTDQGQSGLQDPSGRVYRLDTDGRLDALLVNGASPNGLAISPDMRVLYVAMTRANQIWRGPIQADGSLTKVCALQTFFGVAGPDGLALDRHGRLLVAHPGLSGLFILNERGVVTHFVHSPLANSSVTNVTCCPDGDRIVMTDSRNGCILEADLPAPSTDA